MLTPRKAAADKKSSKSRLGSSWSSRSHGPKSTPRSKPPRPTISGPSGPVKNSRGPDLVRSDTFIIVDGIDDCGYDHSAESSKMSSAMTSSAMASSTMTPGSRTTRRISASFNTTGALMMATPTVASSTLTATPTATAFARREPAKQLSHHSLGASASRQTLKTSSTATRLPRLESLQDENTPPPSHDHFQLPPPLPNSKLPKSRTMNVLHDLKASMSRPSLNARPVNSTSQAPTTSSSTSSSIRIPHSSSKLRLPRQSATPLAPSRPHTPEPAPFYITTAMPSAYWSGRFVALHDRFSSENIATDECPVAPPRAPGLTPMSRIDTPRTGPHHYRPTNLSQSTSTSALTVGPTTTATLTPASRGAGAKDPDALCRRVFLQLDGQCSTPEARRSLRGWQQEYARRHRRLALLPDDGTMEEKSIMARFFGGGVRKEERRRLSSARELASRAGKTGAKRMTLN